ncbi:unnamed protein product [Peronospora destructor]|uniref:Conserved oligomeric Golgi complex subunit 6 n=1 Tax=Peronospora destructor TaxID=86335 RepID=A0AAV0U6D5_9STRA|nr:unnamed protein product [Peronospora destructor]
MAPSVLQIRVQKLLGSRTELEATKSLLHTIVKDGTSVVQLETPTLATLRRNLRSSLETQQLTLAQTALAGLERTLAQISNLVAQVDTLDYNCDKVHKFLELTQMGTEQVQTEAAALATKRDTVQEQWKEMKAFLARYQLTDEEICSLYADDLVDNQMDVFFCTWERVEQVLGGLQGAGSKRRRPLRGVIGTVGCTKKCAEMDGEPSSLLHRAIALLSDREEFYNYCKETLTVSRRSLIVRRFIIALTVGGPNGIPRPIEMHAHDPVRYCGDMLAWVHQAIATESEFFRVLFDGDMEFSPSAATDPTQLSEAMSKMTTDDSLLQTDKVQGYTDVAAEEICTAMVGRAFDDVSRPLQVRVEQTLSSPHCIVTAYKLVHLLVFYHHKFDQLVAHADLARALRHCREIANEAFRHQFQQLVDAVAASAQDYTANLAAAHITLDVSHRLVALLEVFQTSLLPEREKGS